MNSVLCQAQGWTSWNFACRERVIPLSEETCRAEKLGVLSTPSLNWLQYQVTTQTSFELRFASVQDFVTFCQNSFGGTILSY